MAVEKIVEVLRDRGAMTSREIAKVLGVHKHDINKVIYKNPAVIVRVNDKSKHVPMWGVAGDESEDDCEECEWCHEEMELEENDDGDRLCEECMDEWQEQEDKRRRKEEKKARKIIQAQVPKETEEEEILRLAKKVAEMELEVAKWDVPDYSAYGVEKEEEYVCYCMECDKPIKGMTEEEFNEDDELKLCAECEEEQDE